MCLLDSSKRLWKIIQDFCFFNWNFLSCLSFCLFFIVWGGGVIILQVFVSWKCFNKEISWSRFGFFPCAKKERSRFGLGFFSPELRKKDFLKSKVIRYTHVFKNFSGCETYLTSCRMINIRKASVCSNLPFETFL